jgi:hypothetical protein
MRARPVDQLWETTPAAGYGEFLNVSRGPRLSAIEIALVSAMFAPKAGIG